MSPPEESAAAHVTALLADGDRAAAEQRYEDAERAFRAASSLVQGSAKLALALGQTLLCLERRDEALAWIERALAIEPNNTRALHEYTKLCLYADQPAAALYSAERLVMLDKNDAAAIHAVGNALLRLGRVREAEANYRKALALAPDVPIFRVALGILLLLRGEYAEGWALYESRFGMPEHSSLVVEPNKNLWDGRAQPGLVLVIHTEQGIGDIIQFARFLPRVRERIGNEAQILVLCKPSLVELMRTVAGIDEVVPVGPGYDFKFNRQVSMLSLAHRLGITTDTLPNRVPYITAPDNTAIDFKLVAGAKLHVGLVWAARAENPTGRVRSCPLDKLAALFDLDDVHFYSLQFGAEAKDVEPYRDRPNLSVIGDAVGPFESLLAVMQQLDLVVTVDTAAAHLAGAAGLEVWTLLPFAAEWRWGHAGTRTRWYPTMRLFRQCYPGAWDGVVDNVKTALIERNAGD